MLGSAEVVIDLIRMCCRDKDGLFIRRITLTAGLDYSPAGEEPTTSLAVHYETSGKFDEAKAAFDDIQQWLETCRDVLHISVSMTHHEV